MPCTSRTFRRLDGNFKGGINSMGLRRMFLTNTECRDCPQQESKNYTTFCPHAFRAKGDSGVSRVPCGRLREGAPINYSNYHTRKAPCKRTQHIVGQQLPTLLDVTCCVRLHSLFHVIGCCCVLLRD